MPAALQTILLTLCLISPVMAYQPLITDDTGTQGRSGNQIELSYGHVRSATEEQGATQTWPFVYTRGLTDALDVYMGNTYTDIGGHSGLGNTAVGGKWRFHESEKGWSFALKPELQLAASDRTEAQGLGNAKTSYSVVAIASHETRFGEFHANAAWARVNANEVSALRQNQWRISVAPVWSVNEHLKLALDVGAQSRSALINGASSQQNYALLGAIYSPSKDLDLALGYHRHLSADPDSLRSLIAGLTYRFR